VMQTGGIPLALQLRSMKNATFLHTICFSHCPRKANEVAHILASRAEDPHLISWIEEPPNFSVDVIM
jgi:hypothetical protein